MPDFHKGSSSTRETFQGRHRLEHWYRDRTVYFITTRCCGQYPAFATEKAKEIFWHQFKRYTAEYEFEPWVCSLLDNHYHTFGYLPVSKNLGPLLRKIHGSAAKLVNDLLPQRLVPFWSEYFDGCIRDEKQYERAYRYTQWQSVRHGICAHWEDYAHTRITMELSRGLDQAQERKAFLAHVPHKRYGDPSRKPGGPAD